MDFKESKTYLAVFIALIGIALWLSLNIEDQIDDEDYYIEQRDE